MARNPLDTRKTVLALGRMMSETLLIGIGAQKAGTTWLADYLRSKQPMVHLPPVKEVHFFDNMCMPQYGRFFEEQRLAGFKARAARLTLQSIGEQGENDALLAQLARFSAARSPEAYLKFLSMGRADQNILCDITPDYALLDVSGFQMMKDTHDNIKFVYLLRNPADRFWSSLRFNHTHNPAFDVEANFDTMLTRQDFVRFADYERTINAALEVFGPECLHIEFYENLFSDDAVLKFCDWLGVPFAAGDYGTLSNAAIASPMPEERRKQAVQAYLQTYLDMTARFGEALPQNWRADMGKYL